MNHDSRKTYISPVARSVYIVLGYVALTVFLGGCVSLRSSQSTLQTRSDGLVAHYPFDGNAVDVGLNHMTGTVIGAVAAEDRFGNSEGALQIDGFNHVRLNHRILDTCTSFSISTWIKIDKRNWDGDDSRNTYPGNTVLSVSNKETINEILVADGICRKGIGVNIRGKRNGWITFKDSAMEINKWKHYVLVRNNDKGRLYLDGRLLNEKKVSSEPITADAGGMLVGQEQDSVGGNFQTNQCLTGSIDDLLIFRSALTDAEVMNIYTKQKSNSKE